jgi:long-chain acyl-CoA synthetase
MIVPDQIARAVARFPDQVAAICGDEHRSFRELDVRCNRLANALVGLGLKKGDRVATFLDNSIRCIEVDFALAKAGLVRVSVNPRSTAKDLSYILADSDARVLIFGSNHAGVIGAAALAPVERCVRVHEHEADPKSPVEAADYENLMAWAASALPRVELVPEDLYCLFYTSGTTGKPKGVMLSHRSILEVTTNLLLDTGPRASGEKILLTQPLSHGSGFFVLPWFMRGCTCVIMRQFDAVESLRLTRIHAIETVKLIPTMLQRIIRVEGAFDLPKLQQIIYGASPLPTEVLREAIAKFGNKFVQIYGQSEAPMAITVLTIDDHDLTHRDLSRLASAGRPWSTVEVRIVDDHGNDVPAGMPGEVVIRAPQVMSGYWKRPDLTAEAIKDGWLHTKDWGRVDAEGFVYLLGRKDEMIISGGYNIAPREVEDVLYLHPAVQEAAVVGEPDAEWGQAVVAYVAFRDGTTGAELLEFSKAQLGFKKPKRIYRIKELPKNANGKIQKTALKPELAIA